MKRAFFLLWQGITGILAGIVYWFTLILGMRDESRYGKFIRRVVGTSFALIMTMLAVVVIYSTGKSFYEELPRDIRLSDENYDSQYLSPNVTYYNIDYGDSEGYVRTADGKKTIRNIDWIAKPLGTDSLVCYSNGRKRGYFNLFTGQPVIRPQFDHAWIFSDGLASVDDGGWIKFIDATGEVVINPMIRYTEGMDGYVFRNGYCIIQDSRCKRFGMIDRKGAWVLPPEYVSIEPVDSFLIVDNGKGKSIINSNLAIVIPFLKGNIWIHETYISVTLDNHIMQRYSLQGELIEDFYINDISYMTYQTDELRYFTRTNYDGEGEFIGETENMTPYPVEKMASCRRYEAETGWYGLMSKEGKIITPPSYSQITAIGYDRYLCKDNLEDGVVLNGRGEKVL